MAMAKFSELDEKLKQINYQLDQAKVYLLESLLQNNTSRDALPDEAARFLEIRDDETGEDLLIYAVRNNNVKLFECLEGLLGTACIIQYIRNLALNVQTLSQNLEQAQINLESTQTNNKTLMEKFAAVIFTNTELSETIKSTLTAKDTLNKEIQSLSEINRELGLENAQLRQQLHEKESLIEILQNKVKNVWKRFVVALLSFLNKEKKLQELHQSCELNIRIFRTTVLVKDAINHLKEHRNLLDQEKQMNVKILSRGKSTSKIMRLWSERQCVIKEEKLKGIDEVITKLETDTSNGADQIIIAAKKKHPLLFTGFIRSRTEVRMREVIQAENLVRRVLVND
jgi:regulator of replication initiation timing